MSRENAEIVRELPGGRGSFHVERTEQGFQPAADAYMRATRVVAADFVWDLSTFEGWPEQQEFHGIDGFVGFLISWVEPYDEWQIRYEEVVDGGGDKVVAVVHQRGRLQGSQSWIEMHYGIVYTVEAGQIRRAQVYATPDEALSTVGQTGDQ